MQARVRGLTCGYNWFSSVAVDILTPVSIAVYLFNTAYLCVVTLLRNTCLEKLCIISLV